MIVLKEVKHYPDTNSVEATWVEVVTPAQFAPESREPDTTDEDGNVIPGTVVPAHTIPAVERQVRCHSYDQTQMDMLEADLGSDAAQYSELIAKVRNNPIVAPQMSQEQLERQADGEAFYAAEQLLIRTDYLFSVDRHATLLADEPLREAELKASREAAREVIRAYKVKYPQP